MVGILMTLVVSGDPDPGVLLERAATWLEGFDGRVRIRTIWWGEEEARRTVLGEPGKNAVFPLVVRGRRDFRVRLPSAGTPPKGVTDSRGIRRPPVPLKPPRGVRIVRASGSTPQRPPIVLVLVPRRSGSLPSLRLELDPRTHALLRIEAEYRDRTEVHELVPKSGR